MIQLVILSIIATLRGNILKRINDKENVLCFDTHTKEAILSIIEEACIETAEKELETIDDIMKGERK